MTGWVKDSEGVWQYRGDGPPTLEPTPLQRLVIRAVAISTIVVLPLGAIFFVNREQTNNRIHDSVSAIQREGAIRREANRSTVALTVHFNRVQDWQQFDTCVSNEKQDAVIVSILRTIPKDRRPPAVQEAIDALEPEQGDMVCIPPAGERPEEAKP